MAIDGKCGVIIKARLIANPQFLSTATGRLIWAPSQAGSRKMTVYMVERDLKGMSMADLGGARQAAIKTAQDMTARGTRISYIRSRRRIPMSGG